MRLDRVRQMTVSEVVVRGRQEASKWLGRVAAGKAPTALAGRVGPWMPGVRGWPRDGLRSAPWFLDNFGKRMAPRFFEGAVCADAVVRRVDLMPGIRDLIVSTADSICRGRFDLLGYRGLDFGDPVDWHLDPTSGRRAPFVYWSRLDLLDPAVVGDSKVVWELNRHQWVLPLGQAYRVTRDERYAQAFARYMRAWMAANPPGIGINWASSLEVAFRVISWCWALMLFEGSPALSADLFTEMLAGIEDHARHVARYLSLYFSPNTHLTGEALGLFYAGVLFPSLSRASRWRELGARILVEQSERQILADGVYFEQSTYYQRYTAEIYLHFLMLALRNRIAVPDAVATRLQRLLDFLMAVRYADGTMPQIGDADGGWLFPLVPRAPTDLRGVFSVAAALFHRSDYAWAAGDLTPEALWLGGPTGAKVFESLTPAPPQTSPARLFPDGGYAVMGSGWGREDHRLIFDVGPLGCPTSGAHGHADLLGIECAVFGEPYLADAGMSCYTPHPEWRAFFRSTAAHSTVRVDGREQAVPAGPFTWRTRPCARLRRWKSTEAFDFADAEHDAYHGLPDPVSHRRRVLFVKPSYWVIVDDLEGQAYHRIELRFQFAPMEVTMDRNLWACARGPAGHGLFIRSFTTVPLAGEVHRGEMSPIQGWTSPAYGQRQAAPVLVYSAQTRLPVRVLTLILPTRNPFAHPPRVFPLTREGSRLTGVAFEGDEAVMVTEHDITIISG